MKEIPLNQYCGSWMNWGGNNVPMVITDSKLRKLTPRECFRLQIFLTKAHDFNRGMKSEHEYIF